MINQYMISSLHATLSGASHADRSGFGTSLLVSYPSQEFQTIRLLQLFLSPYFTPILLYLGV